MLFRSSQYGVSHHAIEDVAIMRVLPNMTIICPGDIYEAKAATRAAVTIPTPVYIRIGRSDSFGSDQLLHQNKPEFEIGKSIMMREGKDVALVATGSMLLTAARVADKLAEAGIAVTLVSMHTVKPLDEEMIRRLTENVPCIVTLEEHTEIGGLGSAVLEDVYNIHPRTKVVKLGSKDRFLHTTGSREYLLQQHGLTTDQVYETICVIAHRCKAEIGKSA